MAFEIADLQPQVLRRRVRNDLPFLRRFARAITGDQRLADTAVLQLMTDVLEPASELRLAALARPVLYRHLRRLLEGLSSDQPACCEGTPIARQAHLLMHVEGFNLTEAAEILEIDAGKLSHAVQDLQAEEGRRLPAQILIIEDEPLIGMQLEAIVGELGHSLVGVATTRGQAVRLARDRTIDLILSDVQLADSSSGIDAVVDIQRNRWPWVVFITAYPERLLTGERPEPLFLLSKPFDANAVKATIRQALFLAQAIEARRGASP